MTKRKGSLLIRKGKVVQGMTARREEKERREGKKRPKRKRTEA